MRNLLNFCEGAPALVPGGGAVRSFAWTSGKHLTLSLRATASLKLESRGLDGWRAGWVKKWPAGPGKELW